MKLLKNIELPEEFEDAEGYRVDIDDEAMLFHEAYVFTSELDFEDALSRLELLLEQHYGRPQKTLSENPGTVISCVLVYQLQAQTIRAQITGFGDNCGGYIRSSSQWRWNENNSV